VVYTAGRSSTKNFIASTGTSDLSSTHGDNRPNAPVEAKENELICCMARTSDSCEIPNASQCHGGLKVSRRSEQSASGCVGFTCVEEGGLLKRNARLRL